MTENQENKPKKLTLGGGRLSLNKPIDPSGLSKTFVSSKSSTIVEVRKSKTPLGALSLSRSSEAENKEQEVRPEEFKKRLNLLKRAAEEAQRGDETKLKPLSKLAALNQSAQKRAREEEEARNAALSRETGEEARDGSITEAQVIPSLEHRKGGHAKHEMPKNKGHESEEDSSDDAGKKKLDKTVPIKTKIEFPKKLKKTDILGMLGSDEGEGPVKTRSLASIKRAREKEKRKLQEQQKQDKIYREVVIPETISVGDLAIKMAERAADVIRELMRLGIMATNNHVIDADTAELIATTFGHSVKRVQESDVENILINQDDDSADLSLRAPVVTVMGHVDHGKTSLLDALKSTDVVSTEAGGITQHIGAYKVELPGGKSISFIDTPGHEAFTEMRIRGTEVTDIVVLVVAADDGIKTQTIEAINHAKAAGVPIIVAINKIDKPDINIDRVKNELLAHGLVAEDLGGDVIIVPVSALKKTNLDKLEEAILLVAEMADLKANPKGAASGAVIESKVDKSKGTIATILVQRGTLKVGDLVVAGATFGRIKRMKNDRGADVVIAGPSDPIEIYGLDEAPRAGDQFNVVPHEKQARDIVEYRIRKAKEKKVSAAPRTNLEDLFLKASGSGSIKDLPIIIKADVQGSIEAIVGSLAKLPNDEVNPKVIHTAVGGITESDINLAKASNAVVLGFNVRSGNNASMLAEKEKVDIRYYSIIYNLVDDVKAIMSGMLAPIIREVYIGSVEIRQVFNITKVGKVAGSYVTKGTIKRGAGVRLLRDNIVIHEGKLKTLKRFKDDVKEVREGFECGIAFENYDDIREGDTVEVFEIVEEKKQL